MTNRHDELETLEAQIDILARLAPWLKALIAGAFALGVWVASLQITVNQLRSQQDEMKVAQTEWREWRDDVNQQLATQTAELSNFGKSVDRLVDALENK